MHVDHVLAAVPVADMDRAIAWYQQLLGRSADDRPMKEAVEWRLVSGGGIQLVLDPRRAGKSMVTISESDIDGLVADIGTRGLKAHASPESSASFRLARIEDPDGNILTFAQDRRAAGQSASSGEPATLEHLQFPNESAAYRAARNELLAEEMDLRRRVERIAARRRALPPGGSLKEDYVFVGPDGSVRMSELFRNRSNTIAIYSFMFGPERAHACTGCTHFLDGLNGQAEHINQRLDFYVVAKSPLPRIQAFAEERNWRQLLSTGGNSYDRDYFGDSSGLSARMRRQQGFKDGEEWDMPILNVFQRHGDVIRHFWGSELLYVPAEPGQEYRHNDLLDPLWNMLDCTPDGRGDFDPQLNY